MTPKRQLVTSLALGGAIIGGMVGVNSLATPPQSAAGTPIPNPASICDGIQIQWATNNKILQRPSEYTELFDSKTADCPTRNFMSIGDYYVHSIGLCRISNPKECYLFVVPLNLRNMYGQEPTTPLP